eukprot:TRINITY_DN3313_c0_g1_i2.p1 TRINITY_DN3313_c0_g1~~TRINITY_DN3313_c0_g1_i2.p1  ORF type:complete len:334 (-),score=27.00 TRINITY_DN3313_c0_g1_i2:145-1146(-)
MKWWRVLSVSLVLTGIVFLLGALGPRFNSGKEYTVTKFLMHQDSTPGRVAVCVVGGTRGFPLTKIHESQLDNLLPRLGNRENVDVFFQLKNSDKEANCRELARKFPKLTADAALKKFDPVMVSWSDPTCKETWLNTSTCCPHYLKSNYAKYHAAPREEPWAGWESYARKVSCLDMVEKHAAENNITYDWYVVYRPDAYFFEPLLFSLHTLLPNRVYLTSKEANQPPGDYIYFIPRPLLNSFVQAIAHHNDISCTKSHRPQWPPEYMMWDYLQSEAGDSIPLQILQILFAYAGCSGQLICTRLGGEIWAQTQMVVKGKAVSPEEYCQALAFSLT